MKLSLQVLVLTLAPLTAWSQEAHPSKWPAGAATQLNCKVLGSGSLAKFVNESPVFKGSIVMKALDSKKPDFLGDASFEERTVDMNAGTLTLVFTNGCDNYFKFGFLIQNLKDLQSGQAPSITGSLEGWESESSEEDIKSPYTTVSCTL